MTTLNRDYFEEENVPCALCGPGPTRPYDVLMGRPFVQCENCNLVFQNPRIKHKQLLKKGVSRYDRDYFYRHKGRLENTSTKIQQGRLSTYNRELAAFQKLAPGRKIFDVGCGTGRFLDFLPDEWEKHGCDISKDGVEIARDVYGLENVVLGEFEELDLPERSFDLVYFRASLHHVYNPISSLAKAEKILKPDGCLGIFTNCRNGLSGRLLKCHTRTVNVNVNYFFDESVLSRMLSQYGFEIRERFSPYWGTGYQSWTDLPILLATALALRVFRPLGRSLGTGRFDGLVGPAWHRNSVVYLCRRKTQQPARP